MSDNPEKRLKKLLAESQSLYLKILSAQTPHEAVRYRKRYQRVSRKIDRILFDRTGFDKPPKDQQSVINYIKKSKQGGGEKK